MQLRSGLISSLFVAALGAALPVLAEPGIPAIVKRVKPSVVTVVTFDATGAQTGQGTGFHFAPGEVVTNLHVLAGAHRAELQAPGGDRQEIVRVLAWSETYDLAVVAAAVTSPAGPLPLAATLPEEGEQILVVGSPLGLGQTISDGLISAVREVAPWGRILQITAPISPGSSGSPVVNMRGEVVGVAVLQFVNGQNLNFAVPGDRLRDLPRGAPRGFTAWAAAAGPEAKANFRARFRQGEELFRAADYVNALAVFKLLTEGFPDESAGWFMHGLTLFALDQRATARADIERAIALSPADGRHHYGLGLLRLADGEAAGAVAALRRAVEADSQFADAYRYLGEAYELLGDLDAARAAYGQAVSENAASPHTQLRLGRLQERAGNEAEAARAYAAALALPEAAYRLGLLYEKHGRSAAALASFARAVSATSGSGLAAYRMGRLLYREGRLAEALPLLRQAAAALPKLAEVQNDLGAAYEAHGQPGEALAAFRQAAALSPVSDVGASFNAARMQTSLQAYGAAEKSYAQILARRPDFSDAWLNLGSVQLSQNRVTDAANAFRRVLALQPDSAAGHNNLCLALSRLGEIEAAVASCARAAEVNPGLSEPYFNLGAAALRNQNWSAAEKAFRAVLALEPDRADAHFQLGVALLGSSQTALALAAFKNAIRSRPDHAGAHYGLGMAYVAMGDKPAALDMFRILKTLAPALAEKLFQAIYR